ncbi:hypothetical protein BU23DRAFT_603083 [Bimuria novae-zelandiae CBS 107.79]|uniref:Uncharacterized protein n=1 Tax=Bimuria novae-zelandiae CBS 107.79 TaxID=1447943 RepID=A0A6A5UTL5_9PLEO|nr:hypothetical protein BU23DRAFT_603083 [Bimuria novae-zelandiae CBS 107.79]
MSVLIRYRTTLRIQKAWRMWLCAHLTRGGAFRQDSHDLPPDLEEFLFGQADARDFASLQVVFGRGNEFFASDKNGKLEYKEQEPEKKEPSAEELEGKRALRRSRTISFMRPRSDDSQRQSFPDLESPASSRRFSLINGRPTSMALSFQSNSDASLHSLHSQPESRPSSVSHARLSSGSSVGAQLWSQPLSSQTTIPSRPSSDLDIKTEDLSSSPVEEERSLSQSAPPASSQSTRRLRPLSMSFKAGLIPRIPEGRPIPDPESPSPPPPLPLVPSMSQIPMLPIPTPKLWAAESDRDPTKSRQPEMLSLQLQQGVFNRLPSTRSATPPVQQPEQEESPVERSPLEPPVLALAVSTTAQTFPVSKSSTPLSIQLNNTSVDTTPIIPSAAPRTEIPPQPQTLTIQIISTAIETSPISPMPPDIVALPSPPILSMHFSAVSTTPTDPVIAAPPPLSMQFSSQSTAPLSPPIRTLPHPPARVSTSTTSTTPTSTSTSTSTQTSPPPSPLRTALRIDTATHSPAPAFRGHAYTYSTSSSVMDVQTPEEYHGQEFYEPPPVFMGRMMEYYSKPGYELGASLFGGYSGVGVQEVRVERELTEWERANGRGY